MGREVQVKKGEQEDIERLARRKGMEAFLRIVAVAEDGGLRQQDPKTYLYANNLIIERAYGKAAQAVNLGNHEGGPLKVEINIVRSIAQAVVPAIEDHSEDCDGLT